MSKQTIIISALILIVIIGVIYFYNFSAKTNAPEANNKIGPVTELQINTLKQGSGDEAKVGDTVTVNYVGTLVDGTKFDSSIDRGQPFSFTLGENRVIQGWENGILGMKVGEKRQLLIPPSLGYGPNGIPGGPIPPNATLVFEVDLLKINQAN